MMNLAEALARALVNIDQHVKASKGYETESMINPLTPMDSVSAFAIAKLLTERSVFDYCVSVAPEGHVYGYFFERCFGAKVLSVHVDYPPRRCEVLDDLTLIQSKRVLILEDDVASGTTLRHGISGDTVSSNFRRTSTVSPSLSSKFTKDIRTGITSPR